MIVNVFVIIIQTCLSPHYNIYEYKGLVMTFIPNKKIFIFTELSKELFRMCEKWKCRKGHKIDKQRAGP